MKLYESLTNEALFDLWFGRNGSLQDYGIGGPNDLVMKLKERGFVYDDKNEAWIDPEGRTWDNDKKAWV